MMESLSLERIPYIIYKYRCSNKIIIVGLRFKKGDKRIEKKILHRQLLSVGASVYIYII